MDSDSPEFERLVDAANAAHTWLTMLAGASANMPVNEANGLHKTIRNLFEALEEVDDLREEKPMTAIDEIAAERQRQIDVEGWTLQHDDAHKDDALACAAVTYAAPKWLRTFFNANDIIIWPWSEEWWKPKSRRDDLIRAAALIVAEIERLDRKGDPQ